jgi:hypothetical protein
MSLPATNTHDADLTLLDQMPKGALTDSYFWGGLLDRKPESCF